MKFFNKKIILQTLSSAVICYTSFVVMLAIAIAVKHLYYVTTDLPTLTWFDVKVLVLSFTVVTAVFYIVNVSEQNTIKE